MPKRKKPEEIIRNETIVPAVLEEVMVDSMMPYSEYVLLERALPRVEDGLKPVQRRILYTMMELGNTPSNPYKKSARVAGDTMGKYHPHGDTSIYDAMVRMAQDFSMREVLVDGHGNFGSVDGDSAAAMRYTEVRMAPLALEMLRDLEKDTVDWRLNFDDSLKEPQVLPGRFPNLLVNGSTGIAVGLATNIPTHNLKEAIDAVIYRMQNPKCTLDDVMKIMPGPDFPTGGLIVGREGIREAYETGKGKIKLRGRAEIVRGKKKSDKDCIVITEIPYTMVGANIAKFLSDVVDLVETHKLPDITDISNQSKDQVRIVIELKKGADAERILQGLYKKTKLEDTFGVNNLVICDGKPKVLGLRDIIAENIKFQFEINTRKYNTLLDKERSKKEIQEGLIKAVDIIDLIIEIIRGSKNIAQAKDCLVNGNTTDINFKTKSSKTAASKLSFTEAQAQAILELRLSKLIGLEILALQKEHEDTLKKIADYEDILKNRKSMVRVIKKDLDAIRKEYAVPRITTVENSEVAEYEEEPEQEMPLVFAMNRFGYMKTLEPAVFAKNEEVIRAEYKTVFDVMSTGSVAVFTREGTMHQIKIKDIPTCKPKDKGVPVDNLCNYDSKTENIIAVYPVSSFENNNIVFITEKGLGKAVNGTEFISIKKTIASGKLSEGDAYAGVVLADKKQIAILTDAGTGVRYDISELPVQKKTALGVKAVKIPANTRVKAACGLNPKEELSVSFETKTVLVSALKNRKKDSKPEKLTFVSE